MKEIVRITLNGEECDMSEYIKTPVKGVDYFTEADKQELIEAVLAAIPDGSEVSY